MDWVNGLVTLMQQSGSTLAVNVVCHSEGNFMMMKGAQALCDAFLGQVIMLAADINDGAFQVLASGLIGQAAAIGGNARRPPNPIGRCQ
jgi:esterase/lipase superfamily enzyme